MSTIDGPSREPNGINWESLTRSLRPDDIGQVLLDVLVRHNDLMQESGYAGRICKWTESTHQLPVLKTPSHGNDIEIEVSRVDTPGIHKIPIGYFSAVTGTFEISPELVTEGDEAEEIRDAAEVERANTIAAFNKTAGLKVQRLDYADPLIRRLHIDYQEYLNSGIIDLDSILYAYNYGLGPETDLVSHLHADDHTRATVFLRIDSITRRRVSEIGVRVIGAYRVVNGAQLRVPANQIVILERDKYTTSETGFEIKGSRIPHYLADELVEASNELLVAQHSFDIEGRKFDAAQVGVYANPVRPSS